MAATGRAVVPIEPAMFGALYERLLHPMDPSMPRAIWERAFTERGWSDRPCLGWAMVAGGEPVGVLGALVSRRTVDGRDVRFCNLHTWFVAPEHRSGSLAMLRAALALRDHVFTDFSATPEIRALFGRMGFAPIDHGLRVLPPLPWGHDARHVSEVTRDDDDALPDAGSARLVRDHQGTDTRHLVVRTPRGPCHVAWSLISGRGPAHAHIHHVGDPAAFAAAHASIRSALHEGGAGFTVVPERLLRGHRVAWSLRGRAGRALCRGLDAPAWAVDTLYSEMALLKLPAVPDLPQWLLAIRRRLRRT